MAAGNRCVCSVVYQRWQRPTHESNCETSAGSGVVRLVLPGAQRLPTEGCGARVFQIGAENVYRKLNRRAPASACSREQPCGDLSATQSVTILARPVLDGNPLAPPGKSAMSAPR